MHTLGDGVQTLLLTASLVLGEVLAHPVAVLLNGLSLIRHIDFTDDSKV